MITRNTTISRNFNGFYANLLPEIAGKIVENSDQRRHLAGGDLSQGQTPDQSAYFRMVRQLKMHQAGSIDLQSTAALRTEAWYTKLPEARLKGCRSSVRLECETYSDSRHLLITDPWFLGRSRP